MPQWLTSEFLAVWPAILLSDFLRYAIAASALVAFLTLFRRFLAYRRIQINRPGWRDIRREITFSMITIVIFSLVGFSVYIGSQSGIFGIVGDLPASPVVGLVDLAIMIIAHDAYFYWIHRAMHHPRLYRRFHRLHHLSRTPTPWAAYSFAPLEAIVEAAFLPLILLVFETSALVAFAFTTHMIVRNVIGHAGVELFPRKWLDWPILRAITTTTHHDLHHSEFRSNYGLYFTWWDRIMATEHPHYRERFAKSTVRSHAGKPLRKANVTAMVVLLATTAALVSSEARSNAISPATLTAYLSAPVGSPSSTSGSNTTSQAATQTSTGCCGKTTSSTSSCNSPASAHSPRSSPAVHKKMESDVTIG